MDGELSKVRAWQTSRGIVELREDGFFLLPPAGKEWLGPSRLLLNARLLSELPNEAIKAGGAMVPMHEQRYPTGHEPETHVVHERWSEGAFDWVVVRGETIRG